MSNRMILTQEQAMYSGQKRWLSEESIIRAIDHENSLQRSYCVQAEHFQAEAESCLRLAHDESLSENKRFGYAERYKEAKNESEKLFAKADRKDQRLKSLGEKLAAFRTGLLMPITTDPAVV